MQMSSQCKKGRGLTFLLKRGMKIEQKFLAWKAGERTKKEDGAEKMMGYDWVIKER